MRPDVVDDLADAQGGRQRRLLRGDAEAGLLPPASERDPQAVTALLAERGVDAIEWSGWQLLDAYERALGEVQGRERVKVVPREEMVDVSLRRRG